MIILPNHLLTNYMPRVNHPQGTICNNLCITSSDMEGTAHAQCKNFRRISPLFSVASSGTWHSFPSIWTGPGCSHYRLHYKSKMSGCSICPITPFVCPMSPQNIARENRKKQSNYKRFMFSQSPKWHSNSNSKQQICFLPQIFSPQKCHYSRDHHQAILVGILNPCFHQYI